ncbi:MAG: hypothetical protein MJB14_11515 [Spirochaetes bacterium]|nr:hypothetical protein [Spirochaetota bacterium]
MNQLPLTILAHPSQLLRLLILKDVYHHRISIGENPLHLKNSEKSFIQNDIAELEKARYDDPLVDNILKLQKEDGSWHNFKENEPSALSPEIATSVVLLRLAFLGFSQQETFIQKAVQYLFDKQEKDGQWALIKHDEVAKDNYTWVPLQTALPLLGIAAAGFTEEPQAELAYEWLLDKMIPDGAWPTGWASGKYARVAGYRKVPHSQWGCRSNTTACLIVFSLHKRKKQNPVIKKALDKLLIKVPRNASALGFDLARLLGYEESKGFFTFFKTYDPLTILWLCQQYEVDKEDQRLNNLMQFIMNQRNEYGYWPIQNHPNLGKWLTYFICKTSNNIKEKSRWQSQEFETPFQTYPKGMKRF